MFRVRRPGNGVAMHWIWFIIVGAVVGALGRLLHRGRDPMGWLMTVAIGVVAMIVAAAISGRWRASETERDRRNGGPRKRSSARLGWRSRRMPSRVRTITGVMSSCRMLR